MFSDNQVYASAKILRRDYGNDAEYIAREEMLAFIELDDIKEASVWMAIMCAINDLKQQRLPHILH